MLPWSCSKLFFRSVFYTPGREGPPLINPFSVSTGFLDLPAQSLFLWLGRRNGTDYLNSTGNHLLVHAIFKKNLKTYFSVSLVINALLFCFSGFFALHLFNCTALWSLLKTLYKILILLLLLLLPDRIFTVSIFSPRNICVPKSALRFTIKWNTKFWPRHRRCHHSKVV